MPISGAVGHEGAFIIFGIGLLAIIIILGPLGLMINTKGLTKEEINKIFENFKWFNRN